MKTLAQGKTFSSIEDAVKALRRNGFKPDSPRVWKRVRDHSLQTAEVEPFPSGRVRVVIT